MDYYFTLWKEKLENKKAWEERAMKQIDDPSKHEYYMAVPDECILSGDRLRDWCIQSLNK